MAGTDGFHAGFDRRDLLVPPWRSIVGVHPGRDAATAGKHSRHFATHPPRRALDPRMPKEVPVFGWG